MGREITCPKCGAGHQVVNPGITMLVCTNCHSFVYWGQDGTVQLGQESILPANQSRLFLFASGKLDDRVYQVMGHVRYDYGRGNWDEWYLQTADGTTLWVSEDQRVITEEVPIDASGVPAYQQLQVGSGVSLGGETYTVRELATATCVGGEGQLPFSLSPGDTHPYADLATPDGSKFATLEYHTDSVEAYAGHVVDHDRLTIEGSPPPPTTQHQGEDVKCTNCGASLEIPADRQVTTKVCEYCGTQLDLSSDENAILGHNDKDFKPPFLLQIGDAGTFDGARYEVAGRLIYSDAENYQSKEYLLFNPAQGYLWLAEYQGHYTLLAESHAQPKAFSYYARASTEIAGKHYRVYEWGTEHIVYVDGALPWKAWVGENHQFCTMIAPPLVHTLETDGTEQEYFAGRYVPAEEIWRAFEIDAPVQRPSTVGAAQPFVRSMVMKWLMIAGFVAGILNLGLWAWSSAAGPKSIANVALVADMDVREVISEPFTVEPGQVIQVDIDTPSTNPWSTVAVKMLKDGDTRIESAKNRAKERGKPEALFATNSQRSFTRPDASYLFKGPATAGKYRIQVDVTVGSAYRLNAVTGTGADAKKDTEEIQAKLGRLHDLQRTIGVRVSGKVVRGRFFIYAGLLCFLFPIIGGIRKVLFEKARWAPVLDDD